MQVFADKNKHFRLMNYKGEGNLDLNKVIYCLTK